MTSEKAATERGRRGFALASFATGLLLFAGSIAPSVASAEDPTTPEALGTAREIYRTRCVLCHGETGRGDGAGAMALDPKPRDLGDPAWQAAVTDEYVERIIARGGVAVGKSPSMPPNPDLQGKPEIVRALRQLVRGFAQK
jgi:mono/diheme cytochrome c family protein